LAKNDWILDRRNKQMRSIHLVRLQRTRLFGHGHMGKGNTNSSSRSETFFSFQNCLFLFHSGLFISFS